MILLSTVLLSASPAQAQDRDGDAGKPAPGRGRDASTPNERTLDRLQGLSDLYGLVYYFHPGATAADSSRHAWDRATSRAVETVLSSADSSFGGVVRRLLASLGDPGTGLVGEVSAVEGEDGGWVRTYLGYPPDVDNPYGGGFQPFLAGWAAAGPHEVPQFMLHLSEGVAVQVRMLGSGAVPDSGRITGTADAVTSAYPGAGDRVRSAFRVGSVVRYFYPYEDRLPDEWPAVERAAIGPLLAARDSVEFAMAVGNLVTGLHDSHARLTGGGWDAWWGRPRAPVAVRWVDGRLLVSGFTTDSVRQTSGLERGDVVVAVDGEPTAARAARFARYISASTPQALERDVALAFFLPEIGRTTVTVRVRRGGGSMRDVTLGTAEDARTAYRDRRDTPVVRRIDGTIGYIDLDRLAPNQVDSALVALRDTRALILDMRGYPRGTAWTLAPRLATGREAVYELGGVVRPTAGHAGSPEWPDTLRVPPLDGKSFYPGKVVVLVDERTQSQGEMTVLMIRAAAHAAVIGSPSAGANGDITYLSLPGGLRMAFTGTAAAPPDGGNLQRRGIQPDVYARPSEAGLRDGRDEVLDRAVAWVRQDAGISKPQ